MHVSFIGMSNIGKTYWSKRIAAENSCVRIDCDLQIEKKLTIELAHGGFRGLRGVAKWMGLPFDPQYKSNSQRYIECEQSVMRDALDRLHSHPQRFIILDTTGSVIYTGNSLINELRTKTHVVYFEASEDHINNLFKRYIANPKPVIWGDKYAPQDNEAPKETLKRCYLELLRERMLKYRDIAHVTIPFEQHKDRTTDIGAMIRQQIGLS